MTSPVTLPHMWWVFYSSSWLQLTAHWRRKSLNVLAHRKDQTPGVYLCLFKSDLCRCCVIWCSEMKCISVCFFICTSITAEDTSSSSKPVQHLKSLTEIFQSQRHKIEDSQIIGHISVLLGRCLFTVCQSTAGMRTWLHVVTQSSIRQLILTSCRHFEQLTPQVIQILRTESQSHELPSAPSHRYL